MPPSRAKYKRLPDLYITGKEVVFDDATVMWMQVLNPLERDEALHDAHVARGRLVMALKGDTGSDERMKIEASFIEDGHAIAVDRLVSAKVSQQLWKSIEAIQNDPEWTERLEIMARSPELLARPMEDVERRLLEKINLEYLAAVQTRQDEERDYLERHFDAMEDEQLVAEYIDIYLDRQGNDVGNAEYTLTEIWFAARCCDGVQGETGEWDHSACANHELRVFEDKAATRSLPEDLQTRLLGVMAELNMQAREAKNSDRQGSSSDSSPLPSAPAGSTPSTQDVTHVELPGTSTQPSDTPLAS